MPATIDYYLAPQSPWTYLGHARFVAMAQRHGATVRVRPVDLVEQVFPASGGLPPGQRPPQRQAYRLVELQRWAAFLGMSLNLRPKFFPVAPHDAARLIVAVDEFDGSAAALALTGACLKAVWAEERNLADADTLAALLAQSGLPAERLAQSREPRHDAAYRAHTGSAIEAQVFGAPSYVIDGEIFWGQDRLDFVERRLAAA